MIPLIDGQYTEFAARGLFNGLALLGDKRTQSYWDHITGECVHGARKGEQLEFTDFDLLYTTVSGALKTFPQAQIAFSDGIPTRGFILKWVSTFYHKLLGNWLPPNFTKTLGKEDTRLERMTLGLGLWTDKTRRYYPMDTLKQIEAGVVDTIDGQMLFVLFNPQTNAPDAFYIEANSVTKQGDSYYFDTGITFKDGQLCSADNQPIKIDRPQQMFTRWYGFANTFPNCEIYSII